jgi:hypothetical protein
VSTSSDHDVAQVCDRLAADLRLASAYQRVFEGMTRELQVETVAAIASTYFALTQTALLEMCCLIIARVYDSTSGTASAWFLIDLADKKAGTFKVSPVDARKRIAGANAYLKNAAKTSLKPVEEVRHKLLAHRDKGHVSLAGIDHLPKHFAEMRNLIDAGHRAINLIRGAFDDVYMDPEFIGVTDFRNLITVLREGKKTQILECEKHGVASQEFDRMKKELGLP